MEVFKIFATMSLVDIISSPLQKITMAMKGVDGASMSTTAKLGRLAMGMAPVAVAAGALLFAFGSCVSVAAGFEDQMAKVGAVSRATAGEMDLLKAKARELGATTMFTASQVGEAQMYLAMAGFSATQNISALPGVLDMAAATATDLGRASDISSDILSAFGMEAAEMNRVADVLCLTTSTANTNLELLGDTMKYVAPIARQAGLSLEETAAMAGLLGNVGIKGSMAGTSLKAMLNKLAAPTARATKIFEELGIVSKDAEGNLRSPITVLGELAGAMEGMGTADQIEAMKLIVGEEAISGFASLIEREGIGAITKYVKVLEGAGGTAAEMAKRMGDTLGGSLRSLGSAWESLQITIGYLFLPVVRLAADAFTMLTGVLDKIIQHPIGSFVLKLVAALSAGVIGITLFAGAIFLIKLMIPVVLASLGVAAAALSAFIVPILVVGAVIGALYLAFKYNFGGITDFVMGWYNKISLVVRGVIAVFQSLNGGVGTLRGQLAEDIEAGGLLGAVTKISKVLYNFKQFFVGYWSGLAPHFEKAGGVISRAFMNLGEPISRFISVIGGLVSRLVGAIPFLNSFLSVDTLGSASGWETFGNILGNVVGFAVEALVVGISGLIGMLSLFIDGAGFLIALFTGDFSGAVDGVSGMLSTLRNMLYSIFNLFGLGDWFNSFVDGALAAFNNIRSGLSAMWNNLTSWLSSVSLYDSGMKLLGTFVDGIKAMGANLIGSVSEMLAGVREYLPFSDAHKGPLSNLTASGMALVSTLGAGVAANSSGLLSPMQNVLGAVGSKILGNMPDMPIIKTGMQMATSFIQDPKLPDFSSSSTKNENGGKGQSANQKSISIHIAELVLPNVEDSKSFITQLQGLVSEYQGT